MSPRRSNIALPWVAAGAMALAALTPVGHAQTPDQGPAAAARTPGDEAEVLFDRGVDAKRRKAAAAALVADGGARAVRVLLDGLADDSGAGVREAVLAAVAESWSPPHRLFRPIVELLASDRPVDPSAVMPAIAAYRTREAAGILVSTLSMKAGTGGSRAAAAAALQAMTGREDLGADYVAWSRWLSGFRDGGEGVWREALAEGVWRRAARLEGENRAVAAKLVAGYRQLYLALPSDPGTDRAKLLSRMVAEPSPDLRDLGLDIVSRELSAGKTLDGSVGEAVMMLLRDPSPAVRERAAVLVMQLAPAGVGDQVAAALQSESQASPAAALIRAAVRWPRRENVDPAIAWLERSPEATEPASALLLACRQQGYLDDAGAGRVLGALRQLETRDLPPESCRLLAAIGDDHDRTKLAALLTTGAESQRLAAADALADDPAHGEGVLAAAASDPALFEFAVRAVVGAPVTAERWETLAALPAPDAETRNAGLVSAALRMPLPELLKAAEKHSREPQVCELLLHGLAEMSVDLIVREDRVEPGLLVSALIRLAQARLELKRPDLALAALDTLPASVPDQERPRITDLRTVALLWSNQIDRAELEDAPASAWLDGLEAAASEPHARTILRRLKGRFATLAPEEQARLEAITAKIPPEHSSGEALEPRG